MVIKIDPELVAYNATDTSEHLKHIIRKLKASILLEGYEIEVEEPNIFNQVYIKEYDVYLEEDEYLII